MHKFGHKCVRIVQCTWDAHEVVVSTYIGWFRHVYVWICAFLSLSIAFLLENILASSCQGNATLLSLPHFKSWNWSGQCAVSCHISSSHDSLNPKLICLWSFVFIVLCHFLSESCHIHVWVKDSCMDKLNQMYGDCFSFPEFNMIKLIRIQFEVVHKMNKYWYLFSRILKATLTVQVVFSY